MGPRLLCFAGGAALTAFFVQLGLLATPFFGSGAFLWASIFAGFLFSLALGYGVGDLLARAAGPKNLKLAAPRLAVAGGLGAFLAAYYLPLVCREILGQNPDSAFAPLVAIVVVSFLPGALIAAIVPSEMRVRLTDCDAETMAKHALRLLGLMILGGVAGIAATAKPLLRADEVDVYLHAYGTAFLLVMLGVAFLGNVGRVTAVALLASLIALAAVRPSEIQEEKFAVALEETWKKGQGASLYYYRTTHKSLLTAAQLAEFRKKIKRVEGQGLEKPGAILTCEMLLALGEVTVTGEGLLRSLDLLIKKESKPFIMPMFKQVDSLRSDGKGMLYFTIKRRRGKQGAYFSLPGAEPGETVDFWFRDDFTIHLFKLKNVWHLEFGPVTTEHAGVFDVNDTRKTPVRILNVALWIDASLLGIMLEDSPAKVEVKCMAQGEVGGVKTKDVMTIKKKKRG